MARKKVNQMTKEFFSKQASAGIILIFASVLAVLVVNIGFEQIYHNLLSVSLPLNLPFLEIYREMSIKLWIDDGLMAVFFLLVGLELKREILVGELSSKSKLIMPFFAAVGGVVVPILIYYFINFGDTENLRGIAIPAATDIAFAVGILSLFGNKISHSLRVFLVSLAIIDDLVAILIIAFFYSCDLNLTYLFYATLTTLLLFVFNRFKIYSLIPYLLLAPFLWVFILKSGVHPTIAGLILAFSIPLNFNKNRSFSSKKSSTSNNLSKNLSSQLSPAKLLEHCLHIPVSYFILPIFAFANSGIVLSSFSLEIFSHKIVLGIIFGLFLGKQIGIAGVIYCLQKFKICQFFKDVSWLEFYGVTVIAGIGFTMSLFIGNLAFSNSDTIDKVRIGVVCASILSGVFGALILKIATKNKNGKLAS